VGDRQAFKATVRYWRPEQAAGLAVIDLPPDVAAALGGLKQMRVAGAINGTPFTSNTMPAGAGRLAMSMSRKLLDSVQAAVGDEVEVEVGRLDP
jgi:hypothetical protein